jgi:hypothetical protein
MGPVSVGSSVCTAFGTYAAPFYTYCDRCRHSRQLDLQALRERYGAVSLTSLQARLRCSRCGARFVEIFHVWDAGPHARS